MRVLSLIVVIGVLVGPGMLPAAAVAAPLDGSVPLLCALSSVVECDRGGSCDRSSAEEAQVPPFVRINVQQKQLSSVDGSRTSPIAAVSQVNGRLMMQGMQNQRVWGAVVNVETGQMSATIGEDDGAIFISGACIAP
ncbi:MAG TPA: hypothetical protein VMS64_09775 [Candidatus Methylomirabilis sp.]|nr:hypothetical protein [Candidatus Methylomirabilis sp.]